MARPLRIEFPGATYHVTSRGNARNDIFLSDNDRHQFLKTLSETIERYNWLCHSYCLMGNHYHILIETPEGNLAKGMRQLNGVYTQAFNKINQRVGHIFQGRYKAFLIEKEPYLLEVIRYIVLNPVRALLVNDPKNWQWSSYCAFAGITKVPKWLEIDWILGQFSMDRKSAQKEYVRYILNGVGEKTPFTKIDQSQILGFPQFIDWVREQQGSTQMISEVPIKERLIGRPGLDDLFTDETLGDKRLRNDLIRLAHIKAGYSQKEIADFLGVHYTWISRIINKKV